MSYVLVIVIVATGMNSISVHSNQVGPFITEKQCMEAGVQYQMDMAIGETKNLKFKYTCLERSE